MMIDEDVKKNDQNSTVEAATRRPFYLSGRPFLDEVNVLSA